MKKKVIVIGGGIAGLSAGVYAQKCGFDVTILESHSIAGGNCTSWRRCASKEAGGYLFEGGMHWLTGSGKDESINKMWCYIGALGDNVTVHYDEPFIEYNYNGRSIYFYRDLNMTERHFLDISPEDAKQIHWLCDKIRSVKNLSMPIMDIRGVKVTKKIKLPLSLLFSAMSGFRVMNEVSKISKEKFLNSLKHEGIKELIRAFSEGVSGILPMIFTLGTLARGDGGFPEGGSLPFVKRIIKTFTMAGGELLCNTRADKVIVENGKATGVMAGGKKISADAVIVTSDTMTIDNLFDITLKAKWLDKMKEITSPTMGVFISLGINADFKKYNKYLTFKLNNPIKFSNQRYDYLSINNYASDPAYSPNGKAAVTLLLGGDTYDFWEKAKKENRYEEEKKKLADIVITALSAQFPEIKGNIEVIDTATPLTYERYCANWKGSWMTDIKPGLNMTKYPAVIKGLKGVYFAGHRMMPPGGLPVALASGRDAVQYLCRDTNTVFVSED